MKADELLSSGYTALESLLIMSYIDALPTQWRKQLKHVQKLNKTFKENETQLMIKGALCSISKLKQKAVYLQLVSEITCIPTAQKRFNEIYSDVDLDWPALYQLPFKVVTDTVTRHFQNKILNQILYTNKVLFKWNLADKCTFCNNYEETVEHLLYSCIYT